MMWNSGKLSTDSDELCLLDSGITDLRNVPLHKNLQVLNLHCNKISRIEGIEYLQQLRHLDLSSNQISQIEGLDYVVALRTLNLACNLLGVVKGLQNLRNLVKLNLSYNQIDDISGLQGLHGAQYKVSQIELQGNRLQSTSHVMQSIKGCSNLRNISLEQGGASNPVCHMQDYKESMWRTLPRLEVLDGHDRQGQTVSSQDILADIPGLDPYMEYLLSNTTSSSDVNPIDVVTPTIDAAIEAFRSRGATTPEMTSSATLTSEQDLSQAMSPSRTNTMSSQFKAHQNRHELRLEKLENQLAQLLNPNKRDATVKRSGVSGKKSAAAPTVSKHKAKRDIDDTDESDSEKGHKKHTVHKSRAPGYQKNTKSFREKATGTSKKQPNSASKELVVRGHSRSPSPRRTAFNKKSADQYTDDQIMHNNLTNTAKDEARRDDLKQTYVALMKELETERERRWKAEQATKKLVDHVRDLQSKGEEDREVKVVTLQATGRLKEALKEERQDKLKLQAELELLKEQLVASTEKLDKTERSVGDGTEALRTLDKTLRKQEHENLLQQAHKEKKLQEACMRASASQRECEILRSQVKSSQTQVQELQSLLASREQQHRNELEARFTRDGPELQDLLKQEMEKVERLHGKEMQLQQQKVDSLSHQYNELEDEFRLALQIESKRFTQLQEAFAKLSDEAAKDKQQLSALQSKGDSSTSLVSELTSLVKEQKGRLSELSKAKQEQSSEYRERVSTLEQHLEEARKRMLQLELLKQEKVKMASQLQAQESVIEGLKAERKLWGEELAQQGVSLSQDRGRMEAKIEALSSEVATLKKHLERETDTVRIKTKMIEDQTESIKKLKQGLVERDEEVKKVRQELLKVQKDCEEQLLVEMTSAQELQDKLDRARDRKEELKQQLAETEDRQEQADKAYNELSSKWKQKSGVITELEKQVSHMTSTWSNKEKKLTEERDKAMEAARIAVDKIKEMDDAFRQQLDLKEKKYLDMLRRLETEKQEEVNTANKRVLEVEEEMRELLKETDSNKRGMEERIKKMTRALGELQQDLF